MIRIKKISVAFLVAVMLFSLSACNKEVEESAIKVKVNGKVISTEDYNSRLAQMKEIYEAENGIEIWEQEVEPGLTFEKYLEDMVLESMILDIVLEEEAIKQGITVSDEDFNDAMQKNKDYFTSESEYKKFLTDSGMTEEFLEQSVRSELLIDQFLNIRSEEIDKIEPTDAELRDLYNNKKSMFDMVKASHILVDEEKLSLELREKIENGEDFAKLAEEYSTCPSGELGGDLGYFSKNEMVSEFSDVAFAMEIDEISDPVKSDFGYHIIKLTDKKLTFEDINREDLVYQFKSIKYSDMLDKFIENAKIEK